MIGSEPASVFEDRETTGDWRVEKFDEDGGCEVQVFTDPAARQQAIAYAKTRYGTYVEKRLEPYRRWMLRDRRDEKRASIRMRNRRRMRDERRA